MELKQALEELRKEKERKFDQTVDVVVNLKGINIKKDNINVVAVLPHATKKKRVCGFLTKKSSLVDTITKIEFAKYKDKKELKNMIKKYDFFIAHGSLMPSVATTFGKVLGPAGKMPSPQLGILMQESDEAIKDVLEKISSSVKLRAKEPSIKVSVGKLSMKDEDIIENTNSIYKAIVNSLPTKNENVKNVMVKLTMSKSIKVDIR